MRSIFHTHEAGNETAELARRCNFPPPGKDVPYHVAVSGGADSLALLVLSAYSLTGVVAWHVDHGLRPESAKEALVVEEAARRFGVDFRSVGVDVRAGPNLEERARLARFQVLPAGIATGHTADDQAETVLLNMMRGAGSRGLAAMAPGPGKPILGIRRHETKALCDAWGLEPVSDPTNSDLSLRRNALRHLVVPKLGEIFERDPVPILCAQADLLREESEFLDQMANAVDAADCRELGGLHPVLARRALRGWLEAASERRISRAETERALAVAKGKAVGAQLGGGWEVRRSGMRLRCQLNANPSRDVAPAD